MNRLIHSVGFVKSVEVSLSESVSESELEVVSFGELGGPEYLGDLTFEL